MISRYVAVILMSSQSLAQSLEQAQGMCISSAHVYLSCKSSSNVTAGSHHLRHLDSLSISRDNQIALYAKQQE